MRFRNCDAENRIKNAFQKLTPFRNYDSHTTTLQKLSPFRNEGDFRNYKDFTQGLSKFPPSWNFKLNWNVHKEKIISKFPPPMELHIDLDCPQGKDNI